MFRWSYPDFYSFMTYHRVHSKSNMYNVVDAIKIDTIYGNIYIAEREIK